MTKKKDRSSPSRHSADPNQTLDRLRLLAAAIEQCREGVAVADLDGRLLFVNQACAAMHGYTPEELLGKPLSIFHTPEQMPAADAANRQLQELGEFGGESWRVRRDGSVFPTQVHGILVRDGSGAPIAMMSNLRDVSERREIEEAVRESQEKFRHLFENAFIGFYRTTPDGRILMANPALIEMLGFSSFEELAARNLEAEGYRPNYPRREFIERIERDGEIQGLEAAWTRKDGGVIYVREHARIIRDENGNGLYYEGSVEDVTERKEAEAALQKSEARNREFSQQLKTLHELTAELSRCPSEEALCRRTVELARAKLGFSRLGIWFFEDEGRLARGTFGVSEQGQLQDERELLLPVEPGGDFDRVLRGQQPLLILEDTPLHNHLTRVGRGQLVYAPLWDGEEIIGLLCADDLLEEQPLTPHQCEILQLLAANVGHLCRQRRDEQERRRIEAQMQEAQKLESLGVLAGGIAHDFNNILQGILGNLSLAEEDISPLSPAQQFIKNIEAAVRRATELTNQMLAYSGKGQFIIELVDLTDLVQRMNYLLESSVGKKVELRFELSKNLPPLEADVDQLRQLLVGLTVNASEALEGGKGVITITTGVMDCDRNYLKDAYPSNDLPAGAYVFLEVSDTGLGMDKETQAKMFEPFYSTKFVGRGLGLPAILGIVRGHRGAIRIDSQPGRGSAFRILLPASAAHAETPAKALSAAPAKGRLTGVTVLIADDDEVILHVGKRMLERAGCHVLTAANGRQCVDIFTAQAARIDCVLLDLSMPEMDGDEAFREMRRIKADVPVILSSGYSEEEAAHRFAQPGLAGFIKKPYQYRHLLAQLKKVIQPASD